MTKPQPITESVSPGYLPRAEARKELGNGERPLSNATLDRLVRHERLRSKLEERAGRKPERVYLAEDIEKLKRAGQQRKAAAAPSELAPRREPAPARVELLLREIISRFDTRMAKLEVKQLAGETAPPEVALTDKLWLSLDEAVELSGLAKSDLLFVCQESLQAQERGAREQLVVRKSGGWKIQRKSLEAFEG